MFCINCGRKIEDGSRFCIYCGAKVVDGDVEPAADLAAQGVTDDNGVSAIGETRETDDGTVTTETVVMPGSKVERTTVLAGSAPRPEDTASLRPIYQSVPQQLPYERATRRKGSSTGAIALAAAALAIAVCAIVLTVVAVTSGNTGQQGAVATSVEAASTKAKSEEAKTEASTPDVVYVTTKEYVYVAVPEQSESDGYVLPESNSRIYSNDELGNLTNEELWYARNEIYARHGRKFKDEKLQNYFNCKSWYAPAYEPDEFDSNVTLSSIEQKNAENIKKLEQSRSSSYL